MIKAQALSAGKTCSDPAISPLLTAYCFGRATAAEQQLIQAHLPHCPACQQEIGTLGAAVQVLTHEPSLLQTLTAPDIARTFGLSGKLELLWGGHAGYVCAISGIYAALHAVALAVELAYQFDRYRQQVWIGSSLVFSWVWLSSLLGLWLDWQLTRTAARRSFLVAVSIFGLGAAGAVGLAWQFLPPEPVTLLTTQAAPAQAAYLKAVLYCLILNALFLLPPFHFILTMQRELLAGRHRATLGLLTGERLSVPPRGVLFPRFPVLVVCLSIVVLVSLYLHHNLMSHLRPDRYMNLFSGLIYARLFLYYALAGLGLAWYARALTELKRECLAAERTWSGQSR